MEPPCHDSADPKDNREYVGSSWPPGREDRPDHGRRARPRGQPRGAARAGGGEIIHVAPISEQARGAWDATLAVNLTGAMLGIQAVVPGMRSRGGSVINIASIFGVVGAPGYAAYCASKAGLIALTKVAALELAEDNIRVNVIVPGGVSTPMNEHEKEGGVIPDTPLRRRAHPSEISGAVVFLASEDSSFVTGSELVVDGGYLAR
jgi:3alpha(or 20beta)-hydroxysteroid dehydrogenase